MFDALPETRSRGAVLGRGAVSTSILAHTVLIGAVAALSLLATVSPGEERSGIIGIFMRPAGPPPPPLGDSLNAGGRAKVRKTNRVSTPPSKDQRAAAPAPVSPAPPETEPAPVPSVPGTLVTLSDDRGGADASAEGDGSGVGPGPGGPGAYGDRNGVLGGMGEFPVPAGGGEGDVLRLVGGIRPPVLLRRVEPVYPRIAILAKIQGTVVLEGIIGTSGRVESLRSLVSIPTLDPAALQAVEQWLYTPAVLDGKPVKVYLTIRVEFHLD